jgi:hypothetical protein
MLSDILECAAYLVPSRFVSQWLVQTKPPKPCQAQGKRNGNLHQNGGRVLATPVGGRELSFVVSSCFQGNSQGCLTFAH